MAREWWCKFEILALGFYTFSRFRYLEPFPSPTSRVPSRRLGYHGRRLDRRHLRRNRIVASPRSRPLALAAFCGVAFRFCSAGLQTGGFSLSFAAPAFLS